MWTKLIYDLKQARTEEEMYDAINGNDSMGQLGYKQLLESTIGHIWMLKEYYDLGLEVPEVEYDRIETDVEFIQKALSIIIQKDCEHMTTKESTHLMIKAMTELNYTTGKFPNVEQLLKRTTAMPILNHGTMLYETVTVRFDTKKS